MLLNDRALEVIFAFTLLINHEYAIGSSSMSEAVIVNVWDFPSMTDTDWDEGALEVIIGASLTGFM